MPLGQNSYTMSLITQIYYCQRQSSTLNSLRPEAPAYLRPNCTYKLEPTLAHHPHPQLDQMGLLSDLNFAILKIVIFPLDTSENDLLPPDKKIQQIQKSILA